MGSPYNHTQSNSMFCTHKYVGFMRTEDCEGQSCLINSIILYMGKYGKSGNFHFKY